MLRHVDTIKNKMLHHQKKKAKIKRLMILLFHTHEKQSILLLSIYGKNKTVFICV